MRWEPPPAELVERLTRLLPPHDDVSTHTMWGCPCLHVAGHLAVGCTGDRVWVRLGPHDRARALDLDGACKVEWIPGRPLEEYVLLPADLPDGALAAWLTRAFAHATALPRVDRRAW